VGESRDLHCLALREEAIGDPALVENLDGADVADHPRACVRPCRRLRHTDSIRCVLAFVTKRRSLVAEFFAYSGLLSGTLRVGQAEIVQKPQASVVSPSLKNKVQAWLTDFLKHSDCGVTKAHYVRDVVTISDQTLVLVLKLREPSGNERPQSPAEVPDGISREVVEQIAFGSGDFHPLVQELHLTNIGRRAAVKHSLKTLVLGVSGLFSLAVMPVSTKAQLSKVKTVWVILMENHNWTGNNAGAAFGAPDIKGNPLAPYINGELLHTSAHAEQYFNPPHNHPSQPNYLWLEAGTNFGVLADTQPGQPQLTTDQHLVKLLENAEISWMAYAEPDFGSPLYDNCPLDFTFIDVEHLAFVYFNDINEGLNPQSPACISHVRQFYQLSTDLATHKVAQYNFITPNLCHDGHEGISPCDQNEPADNTARSDAWLQQNIPMIQQSDEYKQGGAIFIIWDEAEDSGPFSDGPIGMFILSPFAKGGGKTPFSNSIHYDHSSTLKTLEEIFHVEPLLGAAAHPETKDLSDFFKGDCGDGTSGNTNCGN